MLGGGLWGYSVDFMNNQSTYSVPVEQQVLTPASPPTTLPLYYASSPAPTGLNAAELKAGVIDTSFWIEVLAIIVAELLVGMILVEYNRMRRRT